MGCTELNSASTTKIGTYAFYCLVGILSVLAIVWFVAVYRIDTAEAKVGGGGELQVKQVSGSVGNGYFCAIASDNKAYCWGTNSSGQLGDGTTGNQSTPVAVSQGSMPAGTTIQQISAGSSHTCAVASDNKAYCWGSGSSGRLGNGSTSGQPNPVSVLQGSMPAGTTIQQISVGGSHTCAIASDNKAYCWGAGGNGQLGNGTTGNQSTPVAVSQGAMPAGATIQQISVNSNHTCAVASDNKAYCWGSGVFSQLGNGTTDNQSTPVAVLQGALPAGTTIRQVAAGNAHTCAIASDNKAYCWGYGSLGSLGDGGTSHSSTPVAVLQGALPAGATIQQISVNSSHTCAIASDNKAYCWGSGSSGRLGNGSTSDRSTPVAVLQGALPAGATIQQISAGNSNTCAIASDNKAYCWGSGSSGRLGNGTTSDQYTPVAVSAISATVAVSQSVYRVYGPSATITPGSPLSADNTPATLGAIGGDFRLRIGLTNVENPYLTMESISTRNTHICGIASDNKAYCWGNVPNGSIGNGVTNVSNYSAPVAVLQGAMPAGATIRQIAAGYDQTCAIASDNWAYCWGNNTNGQLGDGATTNQTTPAAISRGAIPADATILQIAAGNYSTCAIASDNKVYCWGKGGNGQLGDGTTTSTQSVPVAIAQGAMPAGATIREISAGDGHICAIASDNWVYCWGLGIFGQIGNGATTVNNTTPVAITQGAMPAGATIREISAGGTHACAIASDNKAYCWGSGGSSQLGNGSSNQQTTPVAVSQGAMPAGAAIRQITAGNQHTCAIASDNKAYCWGSGANGRLGNGVASNSTTPVAVSQGAMPAGAAIRQVVAGNSHICTIASDSKVYCWGNGSNGQLGDGTLTASQTTPVAISPGYVPLNTTLAKVTPGNSHTCTLTSDGQVYCWGSGVNGQLGGGISSIAALSPKRISQGVMPAGAALEVVAGNANTCAIASDNRAYCWGQGNNGQLGNGTNTSSQTTPVAVSQGAMPVGVTILQIVVGYSHICALASDGWVYCWGSGTNGQLGNGSTVAQNTPLAVSQGAIPPGASIVRLAAGQSHTCAIASDGKIYCWGAGSGYRLGNNSTSDQTTPVAVSQGAIPAGLTMRELTAGSYHTCAISSNDWAYCWGGGGGVAYTGNATTTSSTTPVAVSQGAIPAGLTMRELTAGSYHTCALASDNWAYCWGSGFFSGQLGNGTTDSSTTPIAISQGTIPATSSIKQVVTNMSHTCAVTFDGLAYCWGGNTNGQLGTGTQTSTQSAPVTVLLSAMSNPGAVVAPSQLGAGIQVAPLGAQPACSTVSTGWTDISSISDINWGSSPPTHTTTIGIFGSDPSAPLSSTYAYQSIVQSGNFTNPKAIGPAQTGLWDAVLHDRSLTSATDYCLRIVSNTAGTSIDTYSQYPRIKTATGSLGLQLVDDGGVPLGGAATDTAFSSLIRSSSTQQSLGQLVQSSGKKLEVSNSQTNSGWSVSLAATGGPTATWQSTSSNYPYNAATSAAGQLTVDTSAMTKTAYGVDPTGSACATTNLTNGTSSTFTNVVSSITLLTGSPLAQFNCAWRLGAIGLSQSVPANQAGGSYSLDMTMTVVAN